MRTVPWLTLVACGLLYFFMRTSFKVSVTEIVKSRDI